MSSLAISVPGCVGEVSGDGDNNSSDNGESGSWAGKCTLGEGGIVEVITYSKLDLESECSGVWSSSTSGDVCGTNRACRTENDTGCVCRKGSSLPEYENKPSSCFNGNTVDDSCN